ncbi:MAG: AraC family transcriptional regulator [Verrucomicrobiota bacterium]
MKAVREKVELPEGHSFRVLRWSRSLSEVECILGPGRTRPMQGEGAHWHFHKEMELTLFTEGEGTHFIGDAIGPFSVGDLVLLGEQLPHHWHTSGASAGLSIQWHFPESHPIWAFPENLELRGLFRRAERGVRIGGATAKVVAGMMQEVARSRGAGQLAALLRLLAEVAEAPDSDLSNLASRRFTRSAESAPQSAISRSVQHLVANFRDEVRLEDLLRVSGLSRPTFARQVKRHSGRSFSASINQLRLQAARRELRDGDRSVLDVALACGFRQVTFFNRLFRREVGCTPTEYRRRQRRRGR